MDRFPHTHRNITKPILHRYRKLKQKQLFHNATGSQVIPQCNRKLKQKKVIPQCNRLTNSCSTWLFTVAYIEPLYPMVEMPYLQTIAWISNASFGSHDINLYQQWRYQHCAFSLYSKLGSRIYSLLQLLQKIWLFSMLILIFPGTLKHC